ncbi:MAG TPA: potassium channel protein [Chloroflexota bacterium]|nr:potassium channel protein [Chloroflexota bacterium]
MGAPRDDLPGGSLADFARVATGRLREYRGPLILLALILLVGTAGYVLIEHWSPLEALFMTVTTITTVGFEEVHPLDPAGEIFTIVLILFGVGGALYTLGAFVRILMETDWPALRRRRRVEHALAGLRDHLIIAGYGRVGRRVAAVLRREGQALIVVDQRANVVHEAEADGNLAILGDAANDEVLRRAGIARARGLISVVSSDAENVYVVLSAHDLCPDLLIVARASNEDAAKKLEKAGATHVISPYRIAGERMAMLAVRPTAVAMAETLLQAGAEQLLLEEVTVPPDSRLAGLSVAEVRRRLPGGPMVVAVRHDGSLITSPPENYTLHPNDRLVVVGTPSAMRAIEELTGRE